MRSAFTGSIVLIFSATLYAQLLYDVTFEAPLHSIGQAPTLGTGPAPRQTGTEITFGPPVIAAPGVLDGQSLLLTRTTDPYTQLRFGLGQHSTTLGFPTVFPGYRIHLDVVIDDLVPGEEFSFFLDGSTAKKVRFTGSGGVYFDVLGTSSTLLGPASYDVRRSIDLTFVKATRQLNVSVGGVGSWAGQVPYNSSLGALYDAVRVALGSGLPSSRVYVDNLRIESIPEPTTLTTLLLVFILYRPRRS